MRAGRFIWSVLATASVVVPFAGCKREERSLRPLPASAAPVYMTESSPLHPGPRGPLGPKDNGTAPVRLYAESSAYALSEGKRLYANYNCIGCHANGGGGMGPPLMDDKWIYGIEPDTVFETIVKGRPNGMPSFEGKIPDAQIWQIVAYVRSMSGQLSANVASSRDEHMMLGSPENSRPRETPVKITPPPDVLPLPATRPASTPTTSTTSPTTAPGGGK
jgi:cytochrome c oxidase cbb3-type subunit III